MKKLLIIIAILIINPALAEDKSPKAIYARYCAERSKEIIKSRDKLISYCKCMSSEIFNSKNREEIDSMTDDERTSLSMNAAQKCSKIISQ